MRKKIGPWRRDLTPGVDYRRLHDVPITNAGIYNGNLSVADSVAPKISPYFFPPGRGNKEVESCLRKQKAANTG